jgi:hypothetical protein
MNQKIVIGLAEHAGDVRYARRFAFVKGSSCGLGKARL